MKIRCKKFNKSALRKSLYKGVETSKSPLICNFIPTLKSVSLSSPGMLEVAGSVAISTSRGVHHVNSFLVQKPYKNRAWVEQRLIAFLMVRLTLKKAHFRLVNFEQSTLNGLRRQSPSLTGFVESGKPLEVFDGVLVCVQRYQVRRSTGLVHVTESLEVELREREWSWNNDCWRMSGEVYHVLNSLEQQI